MKQNTNYKQMLKNSRSRNNSKNKSEQSKEETKPIEKQQIKYPNPTSMSSVLLDISLDKQHFM